MKPGGIIITIIPNNVGLNGLIQKMLNRPVFDIHILLDLEALVKAHITCSFKNIKSGYFLSTDFNYCNLNGLDPDKRSTRAKAFILNNLGRFSKAIWAIEDNSIPLYL